MEKNLIIIEKFCGIKPSNQKLIEIGNDPNFIFENDPNFNVIRLFDIEGNIINVNSWFECANYVYGGWSINYNAFSGDLFFFGISSSLLFLYVGFKILNRKFISK